MSPTLVAMHILLVLLAAIVVYALLYIAFSVNYLGMKTLYGGKVTDMVFPWAHSMFPTWGHNRLSMMSADPTKYGVGSYWPTMKADTPKASSGMSPDGGMREVSNAPTLSFRRGYDPLPTPQEIVDHSGIPAPTQIEVGWWGY